jgi:TolA-binding protein
MLPGHQISLVVALIAVCAVARADTVWVSSGGGNAMERPRVQVQGIADGKIRFTSSDGRETTREIQQVVRLAVDTEPVLTAAEEAAAKQQWDAATDGYRKAMTSSTKEWVKLWSAQRVIETAQKANRFDTAASGYITFVQLDPARAVNFKPAMPDERSTYLVTAMAEVNKALTAPNLAPAQKQGLLSFLLELQRAKKDQKAAGQTMEQMLQGGVASGNDAGANAALARLKLDAAALALDKKEFDKAINEISNSAKVFVDPKEQAQALYIIAEARAGIAATKNDVPSWQDAALAYMRVATHFKELTGSPLIAQSLLKTAQIEEKLNDPEAARTLYDQVATQYPSDPAAGAARASAQRLKAKP